MRLENIRLRVVGQVGSLLIRCLGRTLRIRAEREESFLENRRQGQPVIFVFWHSRILPLTYIHRKQGIVVLVSEHKDGEYIARIIERMGFGTSRGSSTRGGVKGLKGLVRAAREGHDLGFTPDGPRGPPRKLKPGTLAAARITGAPIVPIAVGGPRVWRLGTWDRHVVPKPFSRITVRYGEPRIVPRDASEEEIVRIGAELETLLCTLSDEVDGVDPVAPPGEATECPRPGGARRVPE